MKKGPLVLASSMLGIGLGGFVDGITLHQILQWHNMLSSVRPPTTLLAMKINMVWDGIFHAFTWLVTLVGVVLLFRAARRSDVAWSGRVFFGGLVAGWGLFNFVEGLIDHQILGIHHVRPTGAWLAWDLGFLLFGAGQILFGVSLIRGAAVRSGPAFLAPRPGLG